MDVKELLKNASLESQGHAGSIQNFDDVQNDGLIRAKSKYRVQLDLRTILAAFVALVLIAGTGIYFMLTSGTLAAGQNASDKSGAKSTNQVASRNNEASSTSEPQNADMNPIPDSFNDNSNTSTDTVKTPDLATGSATDLRTSAEKAVDASGVVNLNLATLEELQTLKGVGPSTAQKILDYRTEHSKFQSKEELMKVKGIGQATFDKLKDKIRI